MGIWKADIWSQLGLIHCVKGQHMKHNYFFGAADLLMRLGNMACLLSLNELCCNGSWWVISHSYFTSYSLLSCWGRGAFHRLGGHLAAGNHRSTTHLPQAMTAHVLDKLNSVCTSLPHTSRVPVSQTSSWMHMVFLRDDHVATARQKYSIWCCYCSYKKALMNSDFILPQKKYGNVMPATFCCSQPLLQSVLLCLFLSHSALGDCAHL